MKYTVVIFTLFFGLSLNAGVMQSIKLDASGTNIATTYTLTGANNVSVPYARFISQICCLNATASTIAFYVDNDTSTVAPTVDLQDQYLPAGWSWCSKEAYTITRTIQFRSDSGSAITTGKVYCSLYDRRG